MRALLGSVAVVWAAGCGLPSASISQGEPADDVEQKEAWSPQDSPTLFANGLETTFSALPTHGDAANTPWAGSYWPTANDNINEQWAGPGTNSPAKKYELAFGGTNVEDAVSRFHGIDSATWQKECRASSECSAPMGEVCAKRRGKDSGRCIATWWGICHAWTPAAILLPEPRFPVTRNGVTFEVPDLKALGSLVHNNTSTRFVSLRCNLQASSLPDGGGVRYDGWGRPSDANRECRDTNAGTYHVLLTNYLGLMGQAFAEDRTNDYQVWNQPLRGFKVISQREVSAAEANRLIGVTAANTDGGPNELYRFNPLAARFIEVHTDVRYISESAPEDGYTAPRIDAYTRTDNYQYVLELDAGGKIIGGEWLGDSKRAHPDFLWLPLGPAGATVAGGAIAYQTVKALVLESSGVPSGPSQPVSLTYSFTLGVNEWRHLGPFAAGTGPIAVEMTGTNDADLFVRLGGQPSAALYDCRPYAKTSTEACAALGPGPLYVSVNGFKKGAAVTVKIRYSGVPPGPAAAADAGVATVPAADAGHADAGHADAGTPDAGDGQLHVSGTVLKGQMLTFTLPVTAGRQVVIRTTAASDVDLYVKLNGPPTTSAYDARAYTVSGNETLRYVPTVSGALVIGVYGYAAATFTLATGEQ